MYSCPHVVKFAQGFLSGKVFVLASAVRHVMLMCRFFGLDKLIGWQAVIRKFAPTQISTIFHIGNPVIRSWIWPTYNSVSRPHDDLRVVVLKGHVLKFASYYPALRGEQKEFLFSASPHRALPSVEPQCFYFCHQTLQVAVILVWCCNKTSLESLMAHEHSM